MPSPLLRTERLSAGVEGDTGTKSQGHSTYFLLKNKYTRNPYFPFCFRPEEIRPHGDLGGTHGGHLDQARGEGGSG